MSRRYTPLAVILVLAATALAFTLVPRPHADAESLIGTDLRGTLAPQFKLRDQWGRSITLQQFRGRPVLLAFLQASCTEQCPLVAETIHRVAVDLDRAGGHPAFLAISTAPELDTPQLVQRFSRAHALLSRWHYLSGTRARLTRVWRGYAIYAAPRNAPAILRDHHTSAVFLLDDKGRERILMAGNPSPTDLSRDLRLLSGLPATDNTQVASVPRSSQIAPDFAVKTTHGTTLRLSSLRGATVVLNFWASWCAPCRRELPRLQSWFARQHTRKVEVLAVNKQEDPSVVSDFMRGEHLGFTVALDRDGTASGRYALPGMPATFVIDAAGRIRAWRLGELDDAWLRTNVDPVVQGGRVLH